MIRHASEIEANGRHYLVGETPPDVVKNRRVEKRRDKFKLGGERLIVLWLRDELDTKLVADDLLLNDLHEFLWLRSDVKLQKIVLDYYKEKRDKLLDVEERVAGPYLLQKRSLNQSCA